MIRCAILLFLLVNSILSAQELQGIKPGISINGSPCLIQNLIYSCVPRTCDSIVIEAGDSVEFCTFQAIELNIDTAYWLRWHFVGATNVPDTILHSYSTPTPLCHYPRWDSAGTFTVEVFYNGDLSAYPTSDCFQQGPSHWFVNVIVMPDPNGVEESAGPDIVVAPNPSDGIFQFRNLPARSCISVTDLSGRVVLQSQHSVIDLCSFGNGIYFASVQSENGTANHILVVE